MTISARYASTCPLCSHPIAVGDRVDWEKGKKATHVPGACPTTPAPSARPRAAFGPAAASLLTTLVTLLTTARKVLDKPKLRLLAPDELGRGDLWLTLATDKAKVPGSVNVVYLPVPAPPGWPLDDFGRPKTEWLGRILPDGTLQLRQRRTLPDASDGGQMPDEVARVLDIVNADPDRAAKAYCDLRGHRCCYCGALLTDEGSKAVGYGPDCADHWGRPHVALGSVRLVPVPVVDASGRIVDAPAVDVLTTELPDDDEERASRNAARTRPAPRHGATVDVDEVEANRATIVALGTALAAKAAATGEAVEALRALVAIVDRMFAVKTTDDAKGVVETLQASTERGRAALAAVEAAAQL
jgi:hypothetical protein